MIEDLEKHIDGLNDLIDTVEVGGKVTILTGSNGSGKSLIRKQLPFQISEASGVNIKKCVSSISMEARTSSNPEWGALSGAMQDTPWMPTSGESLSKIKQLLEIKDRYLVIDEPEIGMGEETVMGLVAYLNDFIANKDESVLGLMVITHNRYIVDNLKFDNFINTNGIKTAKEWLNRKLVPTNLQDLDDNKLFYAIRDRSKKNREKNKE